MADITATYFLRLRLVQSDTEVASNTYWLSTTVDLLDYGAKVEPWEYYTPSRQYADFRALHTLRSAQVEMNEKSPNSENGHNRLVVTLTNTGDEHCVLCGSGGSWIEKPAQCIVPIFWSDNYVTLLPAERRTIETSLPESLDKVELSIQGWNTPSRV